MKFWMDVMRQIEPLMEDYPRVFDAWREAGVVGMVIGPLRFVGDAPVLEPNAERHVCCSIQPFCQLRSAVAGL